MLSLHTKSKLKCDICSRKALTPEELGKDRQPRKKTLIIHNGERITTILCRRCFVKENFKQICKACRSDGTYRDQSICHLCHQWYIHGKIPSNYKLQKQIYKIFNQKLDKRFPTKN